LSRHFIFLGCLRKGSDSGRAARASLHIQKKAKTTPPNGSGGGFLSRVLGFGSSASTTMAQDFDADQAEDNEGEKTDDRLSLSIYDRTAAGRQRGGGRTELPAMTSPPRPKLRLGFGGSSEEDDGEEAALAALSKEHTKKKKGKKRKGDSN